MLLLFPFFPIAVFSTLSKVPDMMVSEVFSSALFSRPKALEPRMQTALALLSAAEVSPVRMQLRRALRLCPGRNRTSVARCTLELTKLREKLHTLPRSGHTETIKANLQDLMQRGLLLGTEVIEIEMALFKKEVEKHNAKIKYCMDQAARSLDGDKLFSLAMRLDMEVFGTSLLDLGTGKSGISLLRDIISKRSAQLLLPALRDAVLRMRSISVLAGAVKQEEGMVESEREAINADIFITTQYTQIIHKHFPVGCLDSEEAQEVAAVPPSSETTEAADIMQAIVDALQQKQRHSDILRHLKQSASASALRVLTYNRFPELQVKKTMTALTKSMRTLLSTGVSNETDRVILQAVSRVVSLILTELGNTALASIAALTNKVQLAGANATSESELKRFSGAMFYVSSSAMFIEELGRKLLDYVVSLLIRRCDNSPDGNPLAGYETLSRDLQELMRRSLNLAAVADCGGIGIRPDDVQTMVTFVKAVADLYKLDFVASMTADVPKEFVQLCLAPTPL